MLPETGALYRRQTEAELSNATLWQPLLPLHFAKQSWTVDACGPEYAAGFSLSVPAARRLETGLIDLAL